MRALSRHNMQTFKCFQNFASFVLCVCVITLTENESEVSSSLCSIDLMKWNLIPEASHHTSYQVECKSSFRIQIGKLLNLIFDCRLNGERERETLLRAVETIIKSLSGR